MRAVSAVGLVAEAATRQGASALASAALGRALLGTVLLGAGGKDGETVELRLRGDGPLRSVLAMADGLGRARGTSGTRAASCRCATGGSTSRAASARASLAVTRLRPGLLRPYTGVVPIVSGGMAKDLALYLTRERADAVGGRARRAPRRRGRRSTSPAASWCRRCPARRTRASRAPSAT